MMVRLLIDPPGGISLSNRGFHCCCIDGPHASMLHSLEGGNAELFGIDGTRTLRVATLGVIVANVASSPDRLGRRASIARWGLHYGDGLSPVQWIIIVSFHAGTCT